jgi:hypothetical protein
MSSRKLRQGAEAQLPEYMNSERISCVYYVCVGFTDDDLSEDRKKLIRQTCEAYEAQSGWPAQCDRRDRPLTIQSNSTVTPRFIDARPKDSASNL